MWKYLLVTAIAFSSCNGLANTLDGRSGRGGSSDSSEEQRSLQETTTVEGTAAESGESMTPGPSATTEGLTEEKEGTTEESKQTTETTTEEEGDKGGKDHNNEPLQGDSSGRAPGLD